MYKVMKRDGTVAPFTLDKIVQAITKAFIACSKPYSEDVIQCIALRVTSDFCNQLHDDIIGVEDIQDSVERVLSNTGYYDVAKAYILYRKQRENVRKIETNSHEYTKIFSTYLAGMSKDTYSVGGLILNNSGMLTKNYWLSDIYEEDIVKSYEDKEIFIHDLDMFASRRAAWSVKELLEKGILPVNGNICSGPGKHVSTLCSQMVNFLGILQNEWSGSQSFSSFDTYLAVLAKKDHLPYEEIKQNLQTFIYGINVPSRWGSKPPFTVIECDGTIPAELKRTHPYIAGVKQAFTFEDCALEQQLVQLALLEVMEEGDYEDKIFKYPVIVFKISKEDLFAESPVHTLLLQVQKKYRTIHFARQSMMHSSIGMVTINLQKLKEETDTKEQFYRKLETVLQKSIRSLETRRNILDSFLKSGLYPYTKIYGVSFKDMPSSIGVSGIHTLENKEECLEFIHTHLRPGVVMEKRTDGQACAYFGVEPVHSEQTDFLAYLEEEKKVLQFMDEQGFVNVNMEEALDSWQAMSTLLEKVVFKDEFTGMCC